MEEEGSAVVSDLGGYVVPKQDCCHWWPKLRSLEKAGGVLGLFGGGAFHNVCSVCSISAEGWLCLQCNQVFCSRYVKGHMQQHWTETKSNDPLHNEGHCTVVSLSDLSIWCYACDQYIKHISFEPYLVHLENLKFSTSKPLPTPSLPSTGFLHDPKAALHHSPTKHYESPLRVAEAYTLLTEKALLSQCRSVRGRAATREELLLAHSAAYLDLLSLTKIDSSKYSSFPADTFVNADSFDVACFAVGGVVEMTSMVLQGEILNGFALIRPPGHHCETDKPGGFCLLNNVAIAAKYARKQYGIGKIMIVDWDVHHGNGTQEIFYRDAGTLYLSLHRYEHSPGLFYPDAGKADRLGEGGAEGRNINVPFPYTPGGYSDDDYEYIFEEIFLPIANEFSPDLVLVSAGFDAARGDPMGEFNVSPECFGRLTQRMHRFAGGKVILVLEGGYHPQVLGECVVHCMEALLKPTTPPQNSQNFQNLNPLTLQLVQSIKTNLSKYWSTFKSQ